MSPTSTQPLDALLEAAVDAIVISDSHGLISRVNPATEAMFGYSKNELQGKNVRVLMPEPDHGQHDSYLRRYRERGKPAIIGVGREVTACHANGSTFPI